MKFLSIILRIIALGLLIYLRSNYYPWISRWNLNTQYVDLILGFFIFMLSANLAAVILSRLYRRRAQLKSGERDNVILGLQNIYYLLIAGAIIITILAFLGIEPHQLFTSLSIVAAAIAIVTKDYLSEIISGIIISFSSEISVGDYIKIGEHKGKIIDLNLTKIAFLNEDDDVIFIPNNTVFNSEIVNYTKKQIRRVSVEFEVALQAIESVESLERHLAEELSDYHKHIEKDSFWLRVVEIRKDSVALKFQYVLKKINRELEIEIRRRTVRRIVDYVKAHYGANAKA
ncbi:MAG: mechanosensitive ion channel [Saprospiraceae bacterium]|nr:mechanosensitive ion channel [Saprospiraceae bacterium]